MKKIIQISGLLLGLTVLFTACEQDPILFDSSMDVVGFSKSTAAIAENNASGGTIDIYLGAPEGTAATEVTLAVSTEGQDNPAIEGQDYTISSKQVSVPMGITQITITPVDNSQFTGNKSFVLNIVSNSKNYLIAKQNSMVITIIDDEHPLKNWIGTYDVAAASYGSPGAWDESWVVTTSPVIGDVTKLQMVGIGGGDLPVIASFDTDAMTITIEPGQDAGDAYAYGPTIIYWGYTDLSDFEDTKPLTGTIQNDGTITVDNWCHNLSDYGRYIWDVFNTTWTKQK